MTNIAEPAELKALVQFSSHCQPSNTERFSILFMFDDLAKLNYLINSGVILTLILPSVEGVEIVSSPSYILLILGPISTVKFKQIWTSRIEDMDMCAIAHNGNTRDKSGRFYKVIIYIAFIFIYSCYTI